MNNNDLHNDSDIKKEIKEYENEAKRDAFRNSLAKKNLIKELKGNLGDVIKTEPNKVIRISDNNKLTFLQRVTKFISKIFKSL